MRIAIDARLYGLKHRGLGRYLVELVGALAEIDHQTEYVLLVDPAARLPELPSNFVTHPVPWSVYGLGEQLTLPLLLWRLKPDLIHFPHFNVPLLAPRPYVVTIHDLIIHHHPTERATTLPKALYRFKLLAYRAVVYFALWRAARVITVSRAVADEIACRYPWVRLKVAVVPLAPATPSPGTTLELPPHYLLTVGAAYPHKNLELVLRAMPQLRLAFPKLALVVVGRNDVFMKRLQQRARDLGVAERVVFWGEASEPELATLYQQAEAYLLPSLSEGFGLGAVEALAHGTPVVAADIPVLREVLGTAAVFIDPTSPSSLAQGVAAIFEPRIRSLVLAAGKQLVRQLSWQTVAEQTRQAYQSAHL